MILADTSVWIDHLRNGRETAFVDRLQANLVLTHPLVIGELAMGNLRDRDNVLRLVMDLPEAVVAGNDEVLAYVSRHALFGLGIGIVDAHLLASTRLTAGAMLWTRDKRLREAAERLGMSAALA